MKRAQLRGSHNLGLIVGLMGLALLTACTPSHTPAPTRPSSPTKAFVKAKHQHVPRKRHPRLLFVYLDSNTPHGSLTRRIRARLKQHGFRLVPTKKQANYTLTIETHEIRTPEPHTYDNLQTRIIRIRKSVSFQLIPTVRKKSSTHRPRVKQTLAFTRNLFIHPNESLISTPQIKVTLDEMEKALTERLLNQLPP